MSGLTYRDAGVDIEAGSRAVSLFKAAVNATHGPEVLGGIGSFGGLFSLSGLAGLREPVLVASTDGVGTKTRVATSLGRYDTIGQDIVNHCVNDILVQGAKPLFFLDYIAAPKLDPEMVAAVVTGCAVACKASGTALLGGETAEMPGVYAPGELDLVGTIVGVVERHKLIDGKAIRPGDRVLALSSSGLHTNGFSLARRVFEGWDLRQHREELGGTLEEVLLAPHRQYLAEVQALLAAGVDIHGLVHLTGGGFIDNPPRVLHGDVAFRIFPNSWEIPPIFQLIQREGRVANREMAHALNLGLGMLIVVPAEQGDAALATLRGPGFARVHEVGVMEPRGAGEAVRWEGWV